ncbi:hypothetical protein HK405_005683 [Cladochytrium tenue]|nr:hypothetical protein HK405_005683 [Cladochytrium tenue]
MTSRLAALTLLAALAASALAALSGAVDVVAAAPAVSFPIDSCVIDRDAIISKYGSQTDLGFTVSGPASYTPGSTTLVAIPITGGAAFEHGSILAYVNTTTLVNSTYLQEHVGSFEVTNTPHAQSETDCTVANVFNEATTSTIALATD